MTKRNAALLMATIAALSAILFIAARARRSGTPPPAARGTPVEGRAQSYETAMRRLAEARARRDRLKEEVGALQKGEREIRGKVEALTSPGSPTPGADKASNARLAAMMRNAALLEADQLIAGLKARLGLTPEQEERIQKFLQEEADASALALEKGEYAALAAEGKDEVPMRRKLQDVLAPTQLEAYDRYVEEEEARAASMFVRAQAEELTQHLGLTGDQTQAVKEALRGDPSLASTVLSAGMGPQPDVGGLLDDFRQKSQSLRTLVTPFLSGPQVLKLDEYLRGREADLREMAELYRLFEFSASRPKPKE